MKFLLTILMTGLSLASHSAELDPVKLITPTPYDRPSSFNQYIKSKAQAKIADTLNLNIQKMVTDKIKPFEKDLSTYFPKAGELDVFVKNIANEGIKLHLTPDVTDSNLISFYGFLGNNLIGKIADKVLEKEGIADPARRALWVNKLTYPFNNCITKSLNALYDASHCIDALAASLVPSSGIAIVYELSKASLNSSLPTAQRTPFNIEQAAAYNTCYAKSAKSASDVKGCALAVMKSGVVKVTDLTLTNTITGKASSKTAAASIKNQVWPTFNSCTNQVGANSASKTTLSDQFMNCIDELVANTGSLIVQDKITTTPMVLGLFPQAEVKKLALEKSVQFKKCTQEQKAKGAKKDGMLDTDPCENSITNEITYKVVSATFRDTARSSIKDNKAQAVQVGNEGVAILDKCWDNKQNSASREACLKKSIVSYSQNVAVIKLDGAIPKTMPGRDDLSKVSVAELSKCLDKELPTNISESNDMSSKLALCTGRLTRNVALKVADYQIRDTAKGNLSEKDTEQLVDNLVSKEFAACIGNTPDDEALEKCGDALTVKAAKHIAEISFHKEVYAYLESSGGLKALNLEKADVTKFLTELNKSNRECIDKKSNGPTIEHVNLCIKGSVKKIAFFFGDIKFNQSIGDMYKDREADKNEVAAQFKKNLSECLDLKNGKEFSISDYTANLNACSDKVAGATTLSVATDQIDTAINSYMKDRPGMELKEKRESLRTELLGNFQNCMASKGANQNGCIDTLKKESTKSIVLNYGKIETKTQLNADRTPAALRPVEDSFISCADSKLAGEALAIHLDECIKGFALSFAKELGTLKLNYLLKQTLGSSDYDKQKLSIDDSINKYHACIDDLKKFSMNEGLTDKLTVCTDALTNRALAIVRSNINTWMTSEQKDAATVILKQEFSAFLPCLSALLPASPYSQQLQSNIDSSVKPLAILLAHYIDYNPENAKQTLQGIISKLSVDLSDVAQTQKAKVELLDFLYQSGGLDQFLKAIVRGTVKDAIGGMSEKDVPPDLRAVLLNKKSFEEIFNTPEGSRIKDAVMEKILKPTLLENADLKGVAYKANMDIIKDKVIKLLVNAPSFGEKAISMTVQSKMNEMNGFTKFIVKNFIGSKDSLDWEKVRRSPAGIEAETYIKEQVLIPKFRGDAVTSEQEKQSMKQAEDLVTAAVKAYGKNK